MPQAEASQELAKSWRRLTRAATAVAVATSPAFYIWLTQQNDWVWWKALLATVAIVVVFRGFADLLFRRMIPTPSLFGIESRELREEDIVGRRRAWFWRFWFKIALIFFVVITIVWLFRGGTWWGTIGFILDGIGNILSSPALWIQVVFVFFLFIANFGILFGPLLAMNLTQIKTFEPGDAQWGVKLDDVRGQAEAKEEVRRVVSIWQSGEQFERHGGKRERGVLFFGPPGHRQDDAREGARDRLQLAVRLDPGLRASPRRSSGSTRSSCATSPGRRSAPRASGAARASSSSTRSTPSACAGRRSAQGGFGGAINVAAADARSTSTRTSSTARGARSTRRATSILETRAWRDKLFASRETPTVGPSGFAASLMRFYGFMFPGGMGGMGGMALNQLLVVMDGIDNPPFMRRVLTNRTNTLLDASFIVPAPHQGQVAPAPGAAPRKRAGLLHRRHERPDRPARPRADPPGPHGPPRLVPHADEARPARHHRPLHQQGLARPRPRPAAEARRDRARDERLLARDDRAGHVDGADDRAPLRAASASAGTTSSSRSRRSSRAPRSASSTSSARAGRSRSTRPGHAIAGHAFMKDFESTRLSIRRRGDSGGHHQAREKEERFARFQSEMFAQLVWGLGAMAAERVFYNENSTGVGGDVMSVTAQTAGMVGAAAMGPQPFVATPKDDETEEEARAAAHSTGSRGSGCRS